MPAKQSSVNKSIKKKRGTYDTELQSLKARNDYIII